MAKSELEKMLSGELYDATDAEITRMSNNARNLIFQYNRMPYEPKGKRVDLLKKLLGRTGNNIEILPPFYCDYGCYISVGENLFVNYNCTILDCARVDIGDNVQFGPNVQIYAAYHPIIAEERIRGPELAAPIKIGNNVWLGGGVIVCQGVEIGENTTIGAGSVVTKSIPSDVFAAGNPCRIIRNL